MIKKSQKIFIAFWVFIIIGILIYCLIYFFSNRQIISPNNINQISQEEVLDFKTIKSGFVWLEKAKNSSQYFLYQISSQGTPKLINQWSFPAKINRAWLSWKGDKVMFRLFNDQEQLEYTYYDVKGQKDNTLSIKPDQYNFIGFFQDDLLWSANENKEAVFSKTSLNSPNDLKEVKRFKNLTNFYIQPNNPAKIMLKINKENESNAEFIIFNPLSNEIRPLYSTKELLPIYNSTDYYLIQQENDYKIYDAKNKRTIGLPSQPSVLAGFIQFSIFQKPKNIFYFKTGQIIQEKTPSFPRHTVTSLFVYNFNSQKETKVWDSPLPDELMPEIFYLDSSFKNLYFVTHNKLYNAKIR
jgi:hypothetical protein